MKRIRKQVKLNKKVPKAFVGATIAGLSFITGLIGNVNMRKREEAAARKTGITARAMAKANILQQDRFRLEDFKEEGEGIIDYYASYGGKVASGAMYGRPMTHMTKGGNLIPISSDTEIAKGNKHDERRIDNTSGIKLLDRDGKAFLEIEDDETIKDGVKVYSDKLKYINGKTYADNQEILARKKGKLEKNIGNVDKIGKSTIKRKLALLDRQEDLLFNYQEAHKPKSNTLEKADDGGDFSGSRRTGRGTRGSFTSSTNTSRGSGFANAFEDFIPYLDNITNAILTSNSPKIPRPLTQKIVPLKTKINVKPQLNQVTRSVDSATKNVIQNSSSSSTVRNTITSIRLKGANQKAQIHANKENIETSLFNQNVSNAQNISRENLGVINRYQDKTFARRSDIQDRISKNVANLAGDFIDKRNFDAQVDFDKERLDIARQDTVGGTALRVDLINDTEIQKLRSNPAYARQQRKRYLNNPRELAKFDAIIRGETVLATPNFN